MTMPQQQENNLDHRVPEALNALIVREHIHPLSAAARRYVASDPERALRRIEQLLELLSQAGEGHASATDEQLIQLLESAAEPTPDARMTTPPRGDIDPELPAELYRFVAAEPEGPEMLSASQAAERLGVARRTIYYWIDAKKLIGWSGSKHRRYIPAEQILGRDSVVRGIPAVLEQIPKPKAAWYFLSAESPFLAGRERPIDALKRGEVDAVVAAAVSEAGASS